MCDENFCNNCQSIIDSNHIDVLEVDAASKTGVDDVRELIEFSRYTPSIAKFKIFIIDEVHMLSKQAFNALLKTLEEPPKYLKFIFATTEVNKIPITVISRCQRYDLSRINSIDLFKYIKNIGIRENKNIEDDALKLIVKISEGSVRDALSLLDRALISSSEDLLTFKNTQEIFGYVDKSSYIDLLDLLFKGNEELTLKHYRKLYSSGVEPNNFLNEFLEILYYTKNINYIKVDGKNFSLNDNDYKKIVSLSKNISSSKILLFWEFTIKTLKEISLVSNPNLSIEMFLIQLMYLQNKNTLTDKRLDENKDFDIKITSKKSEIIKQIKNTKQIDEEEEIEDKNHPKLIKLNNIDDLINICLLKKEMKLKYELENNVNLVAFGKNRLEISFNEKINKNFVKELSEKLYQWTSIRWIISFSNERGSITKKEAQKLLKNKNIDKYKNSDEYSSLVKLIPDLELIDVKKDD